MAFDSSKVLMGFDGQLLNAPVGTAIPATLADVADDTLWRNVGWCVEDGHSFNPGLTSEDAIKAWPRGEIIRRPAPTLEPELTVQLLQHSDALDFLISPSTEGAWILEYKDTATSLLHRLVIPRAMPTEMGELVFNSADIIGHEITIGAVRDDAAVLGGLTGFTFAFVLPGAAGAGDLVKAY